MKGILAKKIGMTRIICSESGKVTPVTILEAPENDVLQVKTKETDGYSAAVIAGFEKNKKRKNTNKNYYRVCEVSMPGEEVKKGGKVSIADFSDVDFVKITSTSKGKGFAGVIKRHNFSRGPETHGSHHHREPGSVGMCAKPARILKGKKMPGRMGADTVTLSRVKVMQIDANKNLIALKGAVPGPKNSFVFIREA